MRSTLAAPALALLLNVEGTGQELLWERRGTPLPVVTLLVGPLAAIGDVNQDGYWDLVQHVGGSYPMSGLWTFSGKDGSTLRIRDPGLPGYAIQQIAPVGDIDRDGIGDYALGRQVVQGTYNRVQVFSGRDERLLWEAVEVTGGSLFGHHMAGDLDVDGDGKPDLVVGAERGGTRIPNQPWPGAIYVYSNQGKLLYTLVDLPGIYYLGRSVAKVGDVDSDGCDDFVSGAIENEGVVMLFSGKTGKLLHKVYGELDGAIGYSVTGCGDIDGDGVPDFAAGTSDGFGECGLVRAYSGRTGKTLYSWRNPRNRCQAGFGAQINGTTDVDLDGVRDLLVVNADYDYTSIAGSVGMYSGRDGNRFLLHRIEDVGGQNLVVLPPQGGSPFPLYACRGQYIPPNYSTDVGRVMMFRATPPGVVPYGLACQGNQASAPRIGIRTVEPKSTRLHLSGGEAGGVGVLLAGVSRTSWSGIPLPFPLSQFGFPSCVLLTSVEAAVPITLGTTGLAAGYGYFDIPLPLSATGLPLHGQWLTLRPSTNGPGGASDALLWRH